MTPDQIIAAHNLPCEECGQAAHHVEVFPRGRLVNHTDRRVRPCLLTGRIQTTDTDDTTHDNSPERTR
ncbi:hypothetical protein [Prauserella cavernicola]|uniref:Uncharacterized protein n=1 Tax=Prauserella cavernicola TaxID=2800127 RepID=A0A934V4V2_9PSEU|nr:hypothetical protein [Prauserella cavernicola]MBK1785109.1 hypothetical protein [Prauserella cavernicola]